MALYQSFRWLSSSPSSALMMLEGRGTPRGDLGAQKVTHTTQNPLGRVSIQETEKGFLESSKGTCTVKSSQSEKQSQTRNLL